MTNTHALAQRLIEWIHGARTFSKKIGHENMRRMLSLLGNPEAGFRSIHVAGTNGKGSVCQFIECALRENGYKTGLFTSPFLVRYQERIRICGLPVSDELFVRYGGQLFAVCERLKQEDVHPTSFELGTALAFLIFKEQHVDIAVIEVGLGGRLDPTNVILPELCVIASIGLDHTQLLGDTIAEIAREKAGILKPGVPAVLYPSAPEAVEAIHEVAAGLPRPPELLKSGDAPLHVEQIDARGARFRVALPGLGELRAHIGMPGRHQVDNARLALCALDALDRRGVVRLEKDKLLRGIERTRWPGRLQWLDERLLLDGAHNEQGTQALARYVRDFLPGRRIVLLTAMMRDKRPEACAKVLSPIASRVIATQMDWPRALPADALAALYRDRGVEAGAEPDISEAFSRAMALAETMDGIVLVCGSLFLVGAVLEMYA